MTEEKQPQELGVWMPADTFSDVMAILTRQPWNIVNPVLEKVRKTIKTDSPIGA